MDEKEFIYSRLHYLNEQVNFLTDANERLMDTMEKQTELMGRILDVIEQMQSPEYASKQVKMAEMKDVADKIKFIREHFKK